MLQRVCRYRNALKHSMRGAPTEAVTGGRIVRWSTISYEKTTRKEADGSEVTAEKVVVTQADIETNSYSTFEAARARDLEALIRYFAGDTRSGLTRTTASASSLAPVASGSGTGPAGTLPSLGALATGSSPLDFEALRGDLARLDTTMVQGSTSSAGGGGEGPLAPVHFAPPDTMSDG